jgi:hypothetical protein
MMYHAHKQLGPIPTESVRQTIFDNRPEWFNWTISKIFLYEIGDGTRKDYNKRNLKDFFEDKTGIEKEKSMNDIHRAAIGPFKQMMERFTTRMKWEEIDKEVVDVELHLTNAINLYFCAGLYFISDHHFDPLKGI